MFVILHVEDDLGHAMLIRRVFETLPAACDIKHVTDGQAAINYLHQLHDFADPATSPRPVLVLLDLNLPKLNGIGVLKDIKGNKDLCDIPVVILTTSGYEADILTCYENGADNYLTKPGTYVELVELLRKLEDDWLVSDAPAER